MIPGSRGGPAQRRGATGRGGGPSSPFVAFASNGKRALSGSRDGTVRVWDLESGRFTGVLDGHSRHVHGVAWAADQRLACSCSRDIRIFDVESGECLKLLMGHADTIRT